ncbi:MAG: hypothetical protein ACOYL6_16760 [Bacteriovoracaceae bacterium]
MKLLMAAGLLLSINAHSQQMNPYRVIFPKALVLEGSTRVSVQKIKLKNKKAEWKVTSSQDLTFNCNVNLQIEGRDLATKNKTIGEHYYGSMKLDCQNTLRKFSTSFNRVLFLGIRNCVQSETVFDQDYCALDVVAFRKEKDMTAEAGDLIYDRERSKSFYQIHSQIAEQTINSFDLIPEGLQTSTIDSYQAFKISLGKQSQEFFVQKPDANSSFSKGQNIYLEANNDVLIADQKLRAEIDLSYNEVMSKLAAVPSGEAGVAEFKKILPSVLKDVATNLKKLLSIITPVEFFQAEKKLVGLEKNLIIMANAFNPAINDRESFRQNYGSLVDEYNRYSTYLSSTVSIQLPISTGISSGNVVLNVSYHNGYSLSDYVYNDKSATDKKIKTSCAGEVADNIFSELKSSEFQSRFASMNSSLIKKMTVKLYIQAYEENLADCHLYHAASITLVNTRNVSFSEDVGSKRNNELYRKGDFLRTLNTVIAKVQD